jgi:hypothetical protein
MLPGKNFLARIDRIDHRGHGHGNYAHRIEVPIIGVGSKYPVAIVNGRLVYDGECAALDGEAGIGLFVTRKLNPKCGHIYALGPVGVQIFFAPPKVDRYPGFLNPDDDITAEVYRELARRHHFDPERVLELINNPPAEHFGGSHEHLWRNL